MTLEQINESYKMKIAELEAEVERLKKAVFSEQDLAKTIHKTRSWQALHLELNADILENAKESLAVSIYQAQQDKLKDIER